MKEFSQCKTPEDLLENGWINQEAYKRIKYNFETTNNSCKDNRNLKNKN